MYLYVYIIDLMVFGVINDKHKPLSRKFLCFLIVFDQILFTRNK